MNNVPLSLAVVFFNNILMRAAWTSPKKFSTQKVNRWKEAHPSDKVYSGRTPLEIHPCQPGRWKDGQLQELSL
jgi:hypothetical protein